MPLTPALAIREDDASGKSIKTGTDGSGTHIQFVALSNGDGAHVGTEASPLAVYPSSSASPSFYATGGTAEEQAVVSASAVKVKEVVVLMDPSITVARYAMVFDASVAQVNGAVPDIRFLIPPQGQASWVVEDERDFASGLVVAISTTANTLTLPGANEGYFSAHYIG